MVAFIEQKCVLARHFADFGMLPDLLALHPAEEGAQRPQTYPGDPDPLGMAPRWLRFLSEQWLQHGSHRDRRPAGWPSDGLLPGQRRLGAGDSGWGWPIGTP